MVNAPLNSTLISILAQWLQNDLGIMYVYMVYTTSQKGVIF